MFEGHINLPTLIVLKWVLLLAYLNHQIPMSYILDSQEGFTSRFLYCGSLLVLVGLFHLKWFDSEKISVARVYFASAAVIILD